MSSVSERWDRLEAIESVSRGYALHQIRYDDFQWLMATARGNKALWGSLVAHHAAVPLSSHSVSWKKGANWAFAKMRVALSMYSQPEGQR